MTQEALVAAIDGPGNSLSAPYLSNIERGYSQPSTGLLKALARVLKADYNDLAVLAEYQDQPDPDAWIPPRDLAPIFQRYQGLFSRDQLEEGERILRSVFFRGEKSEDEADDQAHGEGGKDEPKT